MSLRFEEARAGSTLLLVACLLLLTGTGRSQQTSSGPTRYFSLRHLAAQQIGPADAATIHAARKALVLQAAFFGYDVSRPGWSYTESLCPDIPDHILLQFRRTSRRGAVSLFTALVPRGAGRVQVVPVLYRNATPFQSAIGGERSIAVFNRVLSPVAARKELQPSGHWLELGVCYAEMVGARPRVPESPTGQIALLRAPAPTLRISEANNTSDILFTDRDSPDSYKVWSLSFNADGRLMSARASTLPNYEAHLDIGRKPRVRVLPTPAQPKSIPLPPSAKPETKPLPR